MAQMAQNLSIHSEIEWLKRNNTTIFTRQAMTIDQLIPNRILKQAIDTIRHKVKDDDLKRKIEKPNLDENKINFWGNSINPSISSIIRNKKIINKNNKIEYDNNEDTYLDICLEMPIDSESRRAAPVHLVMVIDTSHSMMSSASVKDSNGKSESHGLVILDIVKHAAQTCRATLTCDDYMSVIEFHDIAQVVQAPIKVDAIGNNKLEQAISNLTTKGSTNMWDACKVALDLCKENVVEGVNQKIFLLTDGLPNPRPSRGFKNELQRYADVNDGFSASIDTFGFGYDLDSSTLDLISSMTRGNYCFIPDAGMVGDLFGNALANLLSTYISNCRINIDFSNIEGLTDEDVNNIRKLNENIFISDTSDATATNTATNTNDSNNNSNHDDIDFNFPWNGLVNVSKELQFNTGPLITGQKRIFTVKLPISRTTATATATATSTSGDKIDYNEEYKNVMVSLGISEEVIVESSNTQLLSTTTTTTTTTTYNASLINLQIIKMDMISCLKTIMKLMQRSSKKSEAVTLCNKFIDKYEKLTTISHNNSEDNSGYEYVQDMIGEVSAALEENSFKRWGVHYLPSLTNAHVYEYCNNWKDFGVQPYAGHVFSSMRDKADDIFNNLPPPTRSNTHYDDDDTGRGTYRARGTDSAPQSMSMSSYNVRGGVCFHASNIVTLEDGTQKKVADVIRGDRVMISSPNTNNTTTVIEYGTIECVVRTFFEEGYTAMCQLPHGLILTPFHPIYVTTNYCQQPQEQQQQEQQQQQAWVHPKTLVEPVVLHLDYTYSFLFKERSSSVVVNKTICGTLAHGVNLPIIGHEYFGTECVVNDLKKLRGYNDSDGIVTITPDDITRDPKTGWINGIVDSSSSSSSSSSSIANASTTIQCQ